MKITIEGRACFSHDLGLPDSANDLDDVDITVLGPVEAEGLEDGEVLLVHPKVSLVLNRSDLAAALRAFREA